MAKEKRQERKEREVVKKKGTPEQGNEETKERRPEYRPLKKEEHQNVGRSTGLENRALRPLASGTNQPASFAL